MSAASKDPLPSEAPKLAESQGEQEAGSLLDFVLPPEGDPASTPNLKPAELASLFRSLRQTAYHWDFGSDRLLWASNAASLLGVADGGAIAKGRSFSLLVDAEHAGRRYDAIAGGAHPAPDRDLRYRIRFCFKPQGRRNQAAIQIEEHGVCRIGANGRPSYARGTMRLLEVIERQTRVLDLNSDGDSGAQVNRTGLMEEVGAFLSGEDELGRRGALLIASVNDLTLINESYGFHIGDEVIGIVGQRLAGELRQRDRIGRYSSNKFGILLEQCAGDGVELIAQRLISATSCKPAETSAGAVPAGITIGAVCLPAHAADTQSALGHAFQALELARTAGGGFALHVPCPGREAERRRGAALAEEIVQALNDRRIMIAPQPIVTAANREPELYECSLEMRRMDGSIAEADEFMPVAERFGLARLIDLRMLELAIEQLEAAPELKLALSVSVETMADPQWLARIEAVAAGGRLTGRLTVEIAETVALAEPAATSAFVRALKELGCRVALADFRAAYTSFRSLRELGVDMVKIDGACAQALGQEPEGDILVRALIELAKSSGIATVAERVRDEGIAGRLGNAGVDYLQGELFAGSELAANEVKPAPEQGGAASA